MSIPPDSPTTPRPKHSRHKLALAGLCGIFLLGCAAFAGQQAAVATGPLDSNKIIIVPHGTNINAIAAILKDNGAVNSSWVFELAARFMRGSLKSGEFDVPAHSSALDIASQMQAGKTIVRTFMVPEGLTSYDIVQLLSASPVMSGTVATVPGEGSLFPNSYHFSYGDLRTEMLIRMQKHMQDSLSALWAARDPDVPLHSAGEALALASVVEKETGKSEERPRIAGVFYNRLKIGMRLQSDPTVAYAIMMTHGGKPLGREVEHDDLSFASPVNTYTSDGIPPQPICNPGRAAIEAVLHPEKNDFLYFVADGNGGHHFAKSLAEHNHNINLYLYGKK